MILEDKEKLWTGYDRSLWLCRLSWLGFLHGGVLLWARLLYFSLNQVSRKLLDIMMGFAAGVMIFVVVEELIPDSQTNGNTDVATLGLMVGFVLMMVLDVALG